MRIISTGRYNSSVYHEGGVFQIVADGPGVVLDIPDTLVPWVLNDSPGTWALADEVPAVIADTMPAADVQAELPRVEALTHREFGPTRSGRRT